MARRPRLQRGGDRSRHGDGEASRQRRKGLDPVAIANQNEHALCATEAFPQQLVTSTLLDLAMARLSGVPVKQAHQAERSAPPPLVGHRDTHTTSPHPHPPWRVRRGPLRIHPPQGPAPLGQTYLRGLLLDGKRKSIEPIAKRLARGDPKADADALEQALQQFCNQSPWDPVAVRRRLAQRMTLAITPAAWVIDDTGFRSSAAGRSGWPRKTAGRWARWPTARSG